MWPMLRETGSECTSDSSEHAIIAPIKHVLCVNCDQLTTHLPNNNTRRLSLYSAHYSQGVWRFGVTQVICGHVHLEAYICTTYKVSYDLDDPQTLNWLNVTRPSCSGDVVWGWDWVYGSLFLEQVLVGNHLQTAINPNLFDEPCEAATSYHTRFCLFALGAFHSYSNLCCVSNMSS